eukprot:tig00000806_g4379.t1
MERPGRRQDGEKRGSASFLAVAALPGAPHGFRLDHDARVESRVEQPAVCCGMRAHARVLRGGRIQKHDRIVLAHAASAKSVFLGTSAQRGLAHVASSLRRSAFAPVDAGAPRSVGPECKAKAVSVERQGRAPPRKADLADPAPAELMDIDGELAALLDAMIGAGVTLVEDDGMQLDDVIEGALRAEAAEEREAVQEDVRRARRARRALEEAGPAPPPVADAEDLVRIGAHRGLRLRASPLGFKKRSAAEMRGDPAAPSSFSSSSSAVAAAGGAWEPEPKSLRQWLEEEARAASEDAVEAEEEVERILRDLRSGAEVKAAAAAAASVHWPATPAGEARAEAMRGKRKGTRHSAETRAKIASAMQGRRASDQTRTLMRQRKLGASNPFHGRRWTPESLEKRRVGKLGLRYTCSLCGEEGHNRRACPSIVLPFMAGRAGAGAGGDAGGDAVPLDEGSPKLYRGKPTLIYRSF